MKSLNEVNRFIIILLAIILPFYLIDSFLAYEIPFIGRIENFIYHTLLQIVKGGSVGILNMLGYDVRIGCLNPANCYNDVIWIKGSARSIQINHMCLALDLIVIYFALIFAYPGHKRTKPWVILGGWVLILVLNIIRIAWLTVTMYNRPQAFDFEHHVLFKAIVFSILFVGWVLWIKYFPADKDKPKQQAVS